jgi:hypothetical protein
METNNTDKEETFLGMKVAKFPFQPLTQEEIDKRCEGLDELFAEMDAAERESPLPDDFIDIIKGRRDWDEQTHQSVPHNTDAAKALDNEDNGRYDGSMKTNETNKEETFLGMHVVMPPFKPLTQEEIDKRCEGREELLARIRAAERESPLPDDFVDIIKGRKEWNG